MQAIHGGDIYRNSVRMDFSVNVNPLGVPEAVKVALHEAVETCSEYPDIAAEKLKCAVSEWLAVPKEYLRFGNGASELFMAIVHGMKPKKTVIPVPSFYGYEYAAEAVEEEVIFYKTQEKNHFRLDDAFFSVLAEEVELLFLANPNNPTGDLLSRDYIRKLLCHCRDKGIFVVLDECFIEFSGTEFSMVQEIEQFENLILVRAFTKIFAIPGVRLGYLVCSNQALLDDIQRQLPEWNLSTFAQMAGCVCTGQSAYIKETANYVRQERQFLERGLQKLGYKVFSSEADFILICSETLLYEQLLEQGILIRDCGNFRGLSKGFYRIAVKSREENDTLLKVMGEIKAREDDLLDECDRRRKVAGGVML